MGTLLVLGDVGVRAFKLTMGAKAVSWVALSAMWSSGATVEVPFWCSWQCMMLTSLGRCRAWSKSIISCLLLISFPSEVSGPLLIYQTLDVGHDEYIPLISINVKPLTFTHFQGLSQGHKFSLLG